MITLRKESQGFLFLISSAFSFSIMSVCIKYLNGRIPITEVILSRSIISIVITNFLIKKNKLNPWGINKKLLIVRAFLGLIALFFMFESINRLPLATATILQYSYPIFTSITAFFLLKESIEKKTIAALIIGWIGIIIVLEPNLLDSFSFRYEFNSILIALAGAFFTALAYTCVRELSRYEESLVIVNYFSIISALITMPFVINNGVLPVKLDIFWLIGTGIAGQIGVICITKGLTLIPASKASSVNYIQVFFAAIFGIILFEESIRFSTFIGSLLILYSIMLCLSKGKGKFNSLII